MSQHEPSFEELMTDIGRRLRPVLPDMPAADFDALVRRIATVKAQWSHTPVTPPHASPAVRPRRPRPDGG
jgi:hypothetical protein